MKRMEQLKQAVLSQYPISEQDAQFLYHQDLDELCCAANEIRKHFCGKTFDICTIINAKSGRCSEDCKYCAQSSHYQTNCEEYPLLSEDEIIKSAQNHAEKGILRYSLVTSGKNLTEREVDMICNMTQNIRSSIPIKVCGSFGLLQANQYKKLKQAGLTRIHNNLETSKEYFPQMCTTHTFEDKLAAIEKARLAGLSICSGGIFGIGESVSDRISLAFSLKEIGVTSVPINLLNPIKGTPCQNYAVLSSDEVRRIVAVYRFILPHAMIRLAGGRGLLPDKGKACFLSGANAAISGDMLTTSGITIERDLEMIKILGFEVALTDE